MKMLLDNAATLIASFTLSVIHYAFVYLSGAGKQSINLHRKQITITLQIYVCYDCGRIVLYNSC